MVNVNTNVGVNVVVVSMNTEMMTIVIVFQLMIMNIVHVMFALTTSVRIVLLLIRNEIEICASHSFLVLAIISFNVVRVCSLFRFCLVSI